MVHGMSEILIDQAKAAEVTELEMIKDQIEEFTGVVSTVTKSFYFAPQIEEIATKTVDNQVVLVSYWTDYKMWTQQLARRNETVRRKYGEGLLIAVILYDLVTIRNSIKRKYGSLPGKIMELMEEINQSEQFGLLMNRYCQVLQDMCCQIGGDDSSTVIKRMYYYMEKNYDQDLNCWWISSLSLQSLRHLSIPQSGHTQNLSSLTRLATSWMRLHGPL